VLGALQQREMLAGLTDGVMLTADSRSPVWIKQHGFVKMWPVRECPRHGRQLQGIYNTSLVAGIAHGRCFDPAAARNLFAFLLAHRDRQERAEYRGDSNNWKPRTWEAYYRACAGVLQHDIIVAPAPASPARRRRGHTTKPIEHLRDEGLMVQLAFTNDPDYPLFFNLTGPVGKGYQNARADDVLLVQYAIIVGAQTSAIDALRPSWSKVTATGTTDNALLAAIMDLQVYRRKKFGGGFEDDGIVSVVRTRSGTYAKSTAYTLFTMNMALQHANPSLWPRLDKDPRCPVALRPVIRKLLGRDLIP
jgi:hypothetical protein